MERFGSGPFPELNMRANELANNAGMKPLESNRESTTREMLGLDGDFEDEGDVEDAVAVVPYTVDDALGEGLFFEKGRVGADFGSVSGWEEFDFAGAAGGG